MAIKSSHGAVSRSDKYIFQSQKGDLPMLLLKQHFRKTSELQQEGERLESSILLTELISISGKFSQNPPVLLILAGDLSICFCIFNILLKSIYFRSVFSLAGFCLLFLIIAILSYVTAQ